MGLDFLVIIMQLIQPVDVAGYGYGYGYDASAAGPAYCNSCTLVYIRGLVGGLHGAFQVGFPGGMSVQHVEGDPVSILQLTLRFMTLLLVV